MYGSWFKVANHRSRTDDSPAITGELPYRIRDEIEGYVNARMDTTAVRDALVKFAKSYKTELRHLSTRKSQLLEVGLLAVCAEHYRLAGLPRISDKLERRILQGEARFKRISLEFQLVHM